MEITSKPTLTTLDHYTHSTGFSPTLTSTSSLLYQICWTLHILVDRLGYFDWLIGAPDKSDDDTRASPGFEETRELPTEHHLRKQPDILVNPQDLHLAFQALDVSKGRGPMKE